MESGLGIRVERIVRSLQQFCAGVCFLTFFFFFFQLVNFFFVFLSLSFLLLDATTSVTDRFLPHLHGHCFAHCSNFARLGNWCSTCYLHWNCLLSMSISAKMSAMKNSHPSSTVSLLLRDWDSHMESFVNCFLDYEVWVLLLWIVFCKFSIPPDFNAIHFWVCQKYQDTWEWMFQLFRNFDAFCTLLQ
jgi:hypothetical protein